MELPLRVCGWRMVVRGVISLFNFASLLYRQNNALISGGVASISSNSIITKEKLFETADKKLYEAKQAGRNKVRF